MSSASAAIGRRADIALSDASRLANDAYFEVVYAIDPEEFEKIVVSSTTSGENKLELPTDFHAPISASLVWRTSWSTSSSVNSSHQTLSLAGIEAMDGRNPFPSGTPKEIAFYNSWIELFPSPNSAYSLQMRYHAHPEDLVSLASVPSVSTPWRKAIELKAREHYANFVRDDAAETKAATDFLRYVATLKSPQAIRQSGEWRSSFKPYVSVGGRRRV
jgi:hypothetical protein